MNENQKMTDSEIRGIIEIAFSDHSLIDDFIDNFHYYDLSQQDVIDYQVVAYIHHLKEVVLRYNLIKFYDRFRPNVQLDPFIR